MILVLLDLINNPDAYAIRIENGVIHIEEIAVLQAQGKAVKG